MPKFVIEREILGAGSMSAQQVQAVAEKSCSVLRNLGPQIQWLHSYVTENKIYCVYIAPNEEMVREHARQGGFPANSVSQVKRIIDPNKNGRGLALAINEGVLVNLLRTASDRPWAREARDQIINPYVYRGQPSEGDSSSITVLDLNLRNNLSEQVVRRAL